MRNFEIPTQRKVPTKGVATPRRRNHSQHEEQCYDVPMDAEISYKRVLTSISNKITNTATLAVRRGYVLENPDKR
jgi:hypothetical protein